MTFPVKFKTTNLRQKKPSICSTYLMYFLYKKHPFRCVLLVDYSERVYKHENPPPSTTQKNTLSGVFFWWTTQYVFTNTRIHPRPLHKKTPFRVCSFGGLLRTCLQNTRIHPRPLHKKTPFRVCSFGGLPRTCLPTRESSPVHYTKKHPFGCVLLVDGDGFEPSKAVPADLQSDPFGRSGTRPGAGDWSRTNNLLITNQLLCH